MRVLAPVILLLCAIFMAACASPQKYVEYTPQSPTPEIFIKIKKDIVDKTIETGTRLGYSVLNYDYDKGSVQLSKQFLDSTWPVTVTTVIQNGKATAHIYAPSKVGAGPNIDDFHKALMTLFIGESIGDSISQHRDRNRNKAQKPIKLYNLIEKHEIGKNTVAIHMATVNYKPGYMFTARDHNKQVLGALFYQAANENDMREYNKFLKMNSVEKKQFIREVFLESKVDFGPIEVEPEGIDTATEIKPDDSL